MITLDDHNILQIIHKLDTSSLKDIILRGHSYGNTKSFIVLGNNAVHLKNAVYKELIEILQDYFKVYAEEYNKFIKYVGAENFSLYKNTNDYVLLETNRKNWHELIRYSQEYDLDQGNSPEYCFNYNGQNILALSVNNNIKFRLLPASSIHNEDSFLYPDNQLCILWELPDGESRQAIETGDVWTAQQTYEWLNKMLEQFTLDNNTPDSTSSKRQGIFRKFLTHIFK